MIPPLLVKVFCQAPDKTSPQVYPRQSSASTTESRLALSLVRGRHIAAASAAEGYSCEFGSIKYFLLCSIGGIVSCGSTHTSVVPLDLVKCRLQVNAEKYKNIINGFKITIAEEGMKGLARGWAPTLLGYSTQGAGKFGLYEVFKIKYHHLVGEEFGYHYRTFIYLAASASAEFFADIGLCPFEAIKVKMQTSDGFASTMREAVPKMIAQEGNGVFFKSLVPLWMRQIPYTMVKFTCFERTLELLYQYVVPKPRSQCTKAEQLVVTFAAGYIAGVFCAVVSHPADTLVSKMNQAKGSSAGDIIKNIGFAGLWKGLGLRIVMIGTLTGLQWFVYDAFKAGMFSSFLTKAFCQAPENKSCDVPQRGLVQSLVAGRQIAAASVAEGDSCEFASPKYFALCGAAGILSCGITHTAIVPLDLVKCRIQVDPDKYKNIITGFRVTIKEDGIRGLGKGWAPTFYGYSAQGLCKFGLYEVFKVVYTDLLGEENAYLYRTWVYLAASASAEFFADIALSPMEAAKVKIQTTTGYANTLREVVPKMYAEEGLHSFYKSLVPLWMRQIPYTMMKFACFERTVELLYKHVVPKPRADCSKGEQLVVTFAAGYIAGVFCAVVSHPADTVVSKLNQDKGSTAIEAAKKLGMVGLWKGLTPRIIMIGTLTALQWFIYDAFKVTMRMPRPPPGEMPESLRLKLEAAAAQGEPQ
ncbi:hypothetical protein NQ318_014964 [Aromia moschata]|uniref:Phosphate carrier protein, mitochondrial n=1 Tax=Aromia moschata TaxID=1265417 RepID=A0AAV8YWP0_9CUCU|nr:hypothetical protein NQ318_014964 [Aromia moschata]